VGAKKIKATVFDPWKSTKKMKGEGRENERCRLRGSIGREKKEKISGRGNWPQGV